jgi:hypothetical protein
MGCCGSAPLSNSNHAIKSLEVNTGFIRRSAREVEAIIRRYSFDNQVSLAGWGKIRLELGVHLPEEFLSQLGDSEGIYSATRLLAYGVVN